MTEQLWECPKCGVIVKVTEVGPPLTLDGREIMESVQTSVRIEGWGQIAKGIVWRAALLRFVCWLCGMDLEVEDSGEVQTAEAVPEP